MTEDKCKVNEGCIFFKHKGRSVTGNLSDDLKNGNLVIVYGDGSILKSDAIGKEYFKNNFESINLPKINDK